MLCYVMLCYVMLCYVMLCYELNFQSLSSHDSLAGRKVPFCAHVRLMGKAKQDEQGKNWVAVKELELSYLNSKTVLFTIYPYYGNLNEVPQQQPRRWKKLHVVAEAL